MAKEVSNLLRYRLDDDRLQYLLHAAGASRVRIAYAAAAAAAAAAGAAVARHPQPAGGREHRHRLQTPPPALGKLRPDAGLGEPADELAQDAGQAVADERRGGVDVVQSPTSINILDRHRAVVDVSAK